MTTVMERHGKWDRRGAMGMEGGKTAVGRGTDAQVNYESKHEARLRVKGRGKEGGQGWKNTNGHGYPEGYLQGGSVSSSLLAKPLWVTRTVFFLGARGVEVFAFNGMFRQTYWQGRTQVSWAP
jgi:hypothetical protein